MSKTSLKMCLLTNWWYLSPGFSCWQGWGLVTPGSTQKTLPFPLRMRRETFIVRGQRLKNERAALRKSLKRLNQRCRDLLHPLTIFLELMPLSQTHVCDVLRKTATFYSWGGRVPTTAHWFNTFLGAISLGVFFLFVSIFYFFTLPAVMLSFLYLSLIADNFYK